jgi:type I restriction enzyme S subunit
MIPKKGKNITKTTITPGSVPVVAGGLTPAYYHNAHNVTAPVITISASGENAGFINLYHQNIWCSDCSFVNKEEAEYLYSAYLFFKSRQDEITKMQQGAAQPHVYPKDLYRLALADPQKDIWQKVECVVTPLFESIKSNIEEVISLSELRDTLLPKLLSGELSISIGQEAISVQN